MGGEQLAVAAHIATDHAQFEIDRRNRGLVAGLVVATDAYDHASADQASVDDDQSSIHGDQ